MNSLVKQEAVSPTHDLRSVIDVHQRRNYYIIPQNKLGQDIFIRAAENVGFSNVLRMPSGDTMPVKVPVSKNMMESHLKGKLSTKDRTMVTVAIVDAEVQLFSFISQRKNLTCFPVTWSDFRRLLDFISCETVLTNGNAME